MSKAKAAAEPVVAEETVEEVLPVKGNGMFAFPDGSTYFGDYLEDTVKGIKSRDGEGTYSFGVESYSGSWRNDQMHGKGVYKFASGATYEGFFANGLFNGEGIYTFADGAVYRGLWKMNNMHGKGEYTDANQTKWTGDFFNGMFDTGKSYISLRPAVAL